MAKMIKFRAWNGYRKIMADYVSAIQNGDTQGTPSSVNVIVNRKNETWDIKNDDVELLQFTGLKDVNGQEIYIGDIVKSNYKYAQPKVSQIITEDGNSYILGEDLATGNEMLVSDHISEIKVIGNVHANPELLEE
ncbi:YopX family protein [Lactiplantibacillus plantarum]|uniref:YopX family protein n=3 Tax=Lactiplantibacillus plantarum TaxID=1590 RepID=UPI002151970F|nr:YopX family protein [Lactiplantibacillus plantarum]MDE5214476.1 YopX family protein [Lactiplantibacillus plantarum]